MTAVPSEQETPFLNMLLKPFIGLFNGLLPLAWLIAFFFASLFSAFLVYDPLGTLPLEVLLVTFTILSGTHVTRHTAFLAKREAAERIHVHQAAESEIAPDVLETANAVIPSYWTLLKHNLVVALFFVPLVAITSIVAFELMRGAYDFMLNTAQNRAGAKFLSILIIFPILAWTAVIGRGGQWVSAFVDERILHTKLNLPVDEETRKRRRTEEIMKPIMAERAKQTGWINRVASSLIGMIIAPFVFKLALGQAFGLLAEIYLMGQRFDEAEKQLKRALEFDDGTYAVNNTVAKFYLYRGEPEIALPYIDRATKAYLKEKTPVSAYNKALRAWMMALMGKHAEADTLMMEAANQVPAVHFADMAEVYLLGGYVAQAQRKYYGSRSSFEMAIKLDPKGIYAQIAQKELA